MAAAERRRRWPLVVGLLGLLALLRWVDVHPIPIPASDPRAVGTARWRSGDGIVGLLIDGEAAPPATFAGATWDWGWLNTLEQEFGPVDVLDVGEPPPELPAWVGAVLSAGAAAVLSPAWEAALERWTRDGGRLLVDAPRGGPTLAAEPRWMLRWEDLGPEMGGDFLAGLAGLAGADTVAAAGPHGAGRLTRSGAALSRLILSLQQGRPGDDLRARESGGHPDLLTPVDLGVLPPELAEVPVADLLERRLIAFAFGGDLLAGLWHVPEGRPGALLPSHDEEQLGDKTLFQADYELEQRAVSAYYIIPGRMSAAGLARLCDEGFEVGVHWDRGYPRPRWERLGIWRYRPFKRVSLLRDQLAQLQGAMPPGCEVRGNRNHGLLWTEEYAGVFEHLQAAGLTYDSTYGPDGDRYGYAFGTGLPFRPLGANGLPHDLLELPFLFQDDERMDPGMLPRFLESSRTGHHQHIGFLVHPGTMGYRPSVERFEAWLDSYAQARAAHHWIGTPEQLVRFWEARAASVLRPGRGEGGELRVQARVGDGQWIWVRPADARVEIDGVARSPGAVLHPAGAVTGQALYALDPGDRRIVIRP